MTYWELIIKEVLNKNNPEALFYYTHRKQIMSESQLKAANLPWKNLRSKKTYTLGAKYPGIVFTQRESECIREAIKGKTIRKIGNALNLSPRTVEFYITKMRRKLMARNKLELVEKVLDSDFLKNLHRSEMLE